MERKVFISAEIGINHNGNLDIAKKLIDVAVVAGCDAVKFQKRTITNVYTKEFLDSPRKSPWGTTQRDQKEGIEFSESDYKEIDKYCKGKGIQWYASAWDDKSQYFLQKFTLKYNKVASAMLTNYQLLNIIAEEKRHTFISVGMSTEDEIKKAVEIFRKADCSFELMHTISLYPMVPAEANLLYINMLREKFNCEVGFSSHEMGNICCYGAVALGATSIERHITLDRSMYGSDQKASIEPMELIDMVKNIRTMQEAMGTGIRELSERELEVKKKLRG